MALPNSVLERYIWGRKLLKKTRIQHNTERAI